MVVGGNPLQAILAVDWKIGQRTEMGVTWTVVLWRSPTGFLGENMSWSFLLLGTYRVPRNGHINGNHSKLWYGVLRDQVSALVNKEIRIVLYRRESVANKGSTYEDGSLLGPSFKRRED